MKADLGKVLILCLLMLAFFSLVSLYEIHGQNGSVLKGDLPKHMVMASQGITNNYPPLFSWISKPFAFGESNYYYFTIILLLLVFPIVFYYFLKDWRVVLFYFSTGFAFRMDLFGSLPMALAGLFFFVFLLKDWRWRIVLLVFSPLVHSQLFFLLLGSWVIIELFRLIDLKKLFAMGLLCNYVPTKIEGYSPIKTTFGNGISPNSLFNLGEVVRYFGMDFAFPLVFLAIKGFINKKRIDLLLVGLFVFVGGFFLYARAEYMVIIVGLIGCTWGVQKLSKNWVRAIYFLCVVFMALNLLHWLLESLGWCLF